MVCRHFLPDQSAYGLLCSVYCRNHTEQSCQLEAVYDSMRFWCRCFCKFAVYDSPVCYLQFTDAWHGTSADDPYGIWGRPQYPALSGQPHFYPANIFHHPASDLISCKKQCCHKTIHYDLSCFSAVQNSQPVLYASHYKQYNVHGQ